VTTDEYHGWTNRETWAASLHLSNSEWLRNGARDAILRGRGAHRSDAKALEDAVMDLVAQNREAHDDAQDTAGGISSMDRDVGSWWRVNWDEVAEGVME
jgi:hypothetical protein